MQYAKDSWVKYLRIVSPPDASMVDLDDMYDFDASPTAKNAEVAPVHQTLLQPPPAENFTLENQYITNNKHKDYF